MRCVLCIDLFEIEAAIFFCMQKMWSTNLPWWNSFEKYAKQGVWWNNFFLEFNFGQLFADNLTLDRTFGTIFSLKYAKLVICPWSYFFWVYWKSMKKYENGYFWLFLLFLREVKSLNHSNLGNWRPNKVNISSCAPHMAQIFALNFAIITSVFELPTQNESVSIVLAIKQRLKETKLYFFSHSKCHFKKCSEK